jgi:hypothetical protein
MSTKTQQNKEENEIVINSYWFRAIAHDTSFKIRKRKQRFLNVRKVPNMTRQNYFFSNLSK